MSCYEKYSLILQAFILIGAVATVIIYYRILKATQNQVKAMLESSIRSMHHELLRISIGDKDILEVFRGTHQDLSSEELKRHLFVNLSLSHIETLFKLGYLNPEQLAIEINHNSQNPYFKAFWAKARQQKLQIVKTGSKKEKAFFEICEKAYYHPTV